MSQTTAAFSLLVAIVVLFGVANVWHGHHAHTSGNQLKAVLQEVSILKGRVSELESAQLQLGKQAQQHREAEYAPMLASHSSVVLKSAHVVSKPTPMPTPRPTFTSKPTPKPTPRATEFDPHNTAQVLRKLQYWKQGYVARW